MFYWDINQNSNVWRICHAWYSNRYNQEIMIFWYKLKLNMIWCEIVTTPHNYAFKGDKVIKNRCYSIYIIIQKVFRLLENYNSQVFLCWMIQEEISEVKMEYFISDLDISLILNQNNFVRKYADLTESRFLLCGTFGNSQITSCLSHAPLRTIESKWLHLLYWPFHLPLCKVTTSPNFKFTKFILCSSYKKKVK